MYKFNVHDCNYNLLIDQQPPGWRKEIILCLIVAIKPMDLIVS